MTVYTPTPTDLDTFDVYVDGEQANEPVLNRPIKQLADKVAWLDDEKLKAIARPQANIPVLASSDDAHDHPSSASNKWKNVLEQFVAGYASWVRLYVGDGAVAPGGLWALTHNAVWDPASGAQNWTKDDTSKISLALVCEITGLKFYQRASGAGTWTSWSSGVGDVSVGGAVNVGANLAVTGSAAIPNVSGSVVVAGNLTAGTLDSGGDVFAGDDVIATDLFQYASPPSRTTLLQLFNSFGEGTLGFGGSVNHLDFSAGSKVHVWPIRLPQGATLTAVQLVANTSGISTKTLRLYKKSGYDFASNPAAMPTDSSISSATTTTSGNVRLALSGLSEVIDNTAAEYFAHFTSGDAGDAVHGIRVTFTDPGPRNH